MSAPAAQPDAQTRPPAAAPLLEQRPMQWLLLLLAAAAPGIAALTGPFFASDDYSMIHRNPFVTGKWPLTDIFTRPHFNHFAPLHELLIVAEWKIFGDHALPYRVVSLLLHFAAALGCFKLLINLTKSQTLALGATLLWAAHPMHSEAVGWIAEQKTMLSALFIFWALALYTDARQAPALRVGGAIALSILGCLAKSTGIVVAPVVLLLELFDLQGEGRPLAGRVLRIIPFAIIAAIFSWLALWAVAPVPVRAEWTLADAIMNAPGALLIYLKTALLPWTASFFHDLPRTTSFADVLFFGRAAALIVFAGFLWLAADPNDRRWVLFGILGWVAGIGPMLNLSLWSYPAYDRFQYIGAPLLFVALALALRGLLQRMAKSFTLLNDALRSPALWLAPVLIVTALGLSRGSLFGYEIFVMNDAVRKAPRNAYSHAGFANTLYPEWAKAAQAGDRREQLRMAQTICVAAENARKCWNFADFFTMPVHLLSTAGYVARHSGMLQESGHFYSAALSNPSWAHFKKEIQAAKDALEELEQLKARLREKQESAPAPPQSKDGT